MLYSELSDAPTLWPQHTVALFSKVALVIKKAKSLNYYERNMSAFERHPNVSTVE
jgi:hypothetical protein